MYTQKMFTPVTLTLTSESVYRFRNGKVFIDPRPSDLQIFVLKLKLKVNHVLAKIFLNILMPDVRIYCIV